MHSQDVRTVYGEYVIFRVVCSKQNRLRIRGKYVNVFGGKKNLCVHGEYVKRLLAYSLIRQGTQN